MEFLFRGCLVEQFYRFLEVLTGFGDTFVPWLALSQLRAKRNVTIPLTLNDRRSIARSPHIPLDLCLELLYYNSRGVRTSTLMKPQTESLR